MNHGRHVLDEINRFHSKEPAYQAAVVQRVPNENRITERASKPRIFAPPKVIDREIRQMEEPIQNHLDVAAEEKKFPHSVEENLPTTLKDPSTLKNTDQIINKEVPDTLELMKLLEKDAISYGINYEEVLPIKQSLNNESSSQEEEPSPNVDLAEKFIAIMEKDSSIEEESSTEQEESASSEIPSFLHDEPASFDESSSFSEESSFMQDDIASMDYGLGYSSRNVHLPIVKLPVLLAFLDINIDLFNSFDLQLPIVNVTKINWSIHSFACQVLLPSPNVFLKGILVADIEYVMDDETYSLHSVKLNIPWDIVMEIDWLNRPELSSSDYAEYMFKGNDHKNIHYQREYTQKYAQPIHCELEHVHFTWHDEFILENGMRALDIQGKVRLSINLLQSKYIKLNII